MEVYFANEHNNPPKPFNLHYNPLAVKWSEAASKAVAKMEPFVSRAERRLAWVKAYEQAKERSLINETA
jgi:hypothetical protein